MVEITDIVHPPDLVTSTSNIIDNVRVVTI